MRVKSKSIIFYLTHNITTMDVDKYAFISVYYIPS